MRDPGNEVGLSRLLSCGISELVEHNTPNNLPNNNSKQYEFNWGNTIDSRFVNDPSSDCTS